MVVSSLNCFRDQVFRYQLPCRSQGAGSWGCCSHLLAAAGCWQLSAVPWVLQPGGTRQLARHRVDPVKLQTKVHTKVRNNGEGP